jgi:beta-1,4-N-acetylglucosaminyltransferase
VNKSVLILTGNTPFNALEKMVHELSKQIPDITFTLQSIQPLVSSSVNLHLTEFISEASFKEYDLIITHAGAGTVFFLLNCNLPFIAIPNLERRDQHQIELYNWLKKNNYSQTALVEELKSDLIVKKHNLTGSQIALPGFNVEILINELFG